MQKSAIDTLPRLVRVQVHVEGFDTLAHVVRKALRAQELRQAIHPLLVKLLRHLPWEQGPEVQVPRVFKREFSS